MKRFVLFYIVILSFIFTSVSAQNPADSLNKIDSNFKSECFEYYERINKFEVWNNDDARYKTYKINTNKDNLIFTQFGFIIPSKKYIEENNTFVYKLNRKFVFQNLNDNNRKTFLENDTSSVGKELKIEIHTLSSRIKGIEKGTFDFVFDYKSNYYTPRFFIIINGKETEVTKHNINDFSFSNMIIRFYSIGNNKEIAENIEIYELSFTKKLKTYLVKSFYNDDIEVYSNYNCKEYVSYNAKPYNLFEIDKETKSIKLEMNKNPKYNVYTESDIDNDWVEDKTDNCKSRYNPDQLDSNGDGIGDTCSDFDKDGIIGYYDNCPKVSNRDQKDININGIGDVCEFDKDKDGIFDSRDNCINTINPEQEDSDKDGIGNACDNCELYNPRQLDKDKSSVGDTCEKKKKAIEENDIDKDKVIDEIDNCKEISNPLQEDKDLDFIGDVCDNCMEVQNKDQIDLDKNGIGDMCEDSDNDSFLGYLDNCINISNPKQKDSDNDSIGDKCEDDDSDGVLFNVDNCPYDYNPTQSDIDADLEGDACDKGDNRYIESNKEFFIGLLIFIVVIFGAGIFFMSKKLNRK